MRRIRAQYGYAASRQLLTELGRRLNDIARAHDEVLLVGDDEYALILSDLLNHGHATLAATRILNAVATPFTIGAVNYNATVSIGITIFPDDAANADALSRCADLALATAERTQAPYACYADTPTSVTVASWELEGELREALENSELEMYYQPQLDLASGTVCGAEALMRWNHPGRGLLIPGLFIGAAERTGQIRPISWAGLNMALQAASQWPRLDAPLTVGVNISAILLGEPEFAELVLDALAIWGIAPERLVLEITETAVMRQFDTSYAALKRLHERGVEILIDDFGTGYSSLRYFRSLPASALKIDKSFVMKLASNDEDRHIVESIVGLARKFDLRVTAEGASDAETMEILHQLGCDTVQGYYVGRPMSQAEFIDYLETRNNSTVHSFEKEAIGATGNG